MTWTFSAERPIYQQIAEVIRIEIIRGRYAMGERLPSVRDLAAEAAVNPNTMQRALAELENTGLISAQRTSGRFVTNDVGIITEVKKQMALQLTEDFMKKMSGIGYTLQEATELLHALQKGVGNNGDHT